MTSLSERTAKDDAVGLTRKGEVRPMVALALPVGSRNSAGWRWG